LPAYSHNIKFFYLQTYKKTLTLPGTKYSNVLYKQRCKQYPTKNAKNVVTTLHIPHTVLHSILDSKNLDILLKTLKIILISIYSTLTQILVLLIPIPNAILTLFHH